MCVGVGGVGVGVGLAVRVPTCGHVTSQLFGIQWTIVHQAPLSMEFFRQEY